MTTPSQSDSSVVTYDTLKSQMCEIDNLMREQAANKRVNTLAFDLLTMSHTSYPILYNTMMRNALCKYIHIMSGMYDDGIMLSSTSLLSSYVTTLWLDDKKGFDVIRRFAGDTVYKAVNCVVVGAHDCKLHLTNTEHERYAAVVKLSIDTLSAQRLSKRCSSTNASMYYMRNLLGALYPQLIFKWNYIESFASYLVKHADEFESLPDESDCEVRRARLTEFFEHQNR